MSRGRGRPTIYTPELGERICTRLAAGESLNRICKDEGMPCPATVYLWVVKGIDDFSERYAQAREAQAHCLAQRVLDLVTEVELPEGIDPQRAKVAIDGLKWIAGRMAPNSYGDRQKIETEQRITYLKAIPEDDIRGAT